MGHIVCKLPGNTRGAQQRYKTASAPSLQFAADTLPSLTLANAVEDTRFGGKSGNSCALVCSGENALFKVRASVWDVESTRSRTLRADAFGVRAKFRHCASRFGVLVVMNFDLTPKACTI
jgi:hypothetical protein